MRILADLADDDVKWLDERARELGKSRAAILRDAVAAFRAEAGKDWLEQGFGLWANHGFAEDGLAYQSRMREEWVREWDTDHDLARHGPDSDVKDAAE